MLESNTNKNNLNIREWQRLPNWIISKFDDTRYAVRVGVSSSKPKEIRLYEDDHISLCKYLIDEKKVLGYTVFMKVEFYSNQANWYLSLINKNVANHITPVCIYKDAQVHVHTFNNMNNKSYLFALRSKKPR
jgi:hypothetical protein